MSKLNWFAQPTFATMAEFYEWLAQYQPEVESYLDLEPGRLTPWLEEIQQAKPDPDTEYVAVEFGASQVAIVDDPIAEPPEFYLLAKEGEDWFDTLTFATPDSYIALPLVTTNTIIKSKVFIPGEHVERLEDPYLFTLHDLVTTWWSAFEDFSHPMERDLYTEHYPGVEALTYV